MKKSVKYLLLLLLPILLSCENEEAPQREETDASPQKVTVVNNRAEEGENVLLIITYVKDESRAAYEKFMNEIFFELTAKSKLPLMDDQDRQTRWLLPSRKNEDGTWTYAFFMDPVVENGNYEFLPLFEESYSKERSAELLKEYESFMASPPEFHSLLQSDH